MTNDLETLLRDTLSARAETITRGPNWQPAQPRQRRRRWVAPLIAAAAVLAVAGTVVAIHASSGRQRATHPSGTPSPTPTSSAPSLTAMCTTSLPSVWRTRLADGTGTFGAESAYPLAAGADGAVLVTRDFGTARDVVLVARDGSVRRIYSVPAPDQNQVLDGALDGNYALIDVSRLPRNSNGVLQTVIQVVLVDLHTGKQTVVARADASGGRTIDGATLYDGRVYYDVRPKYVSRRSAIHVYDIAHRSDRVVATALGNGPGEAPTLMPQGVVWSRATMQLGAARQLPGPVARAINGDPLRTHLATDGTAYAWIPGPRELAWWAPSLKAPRVFVLPGGASSLTPTVAGPLVLYTPDTAQQEEYSQYMLDARTGASTVLPHVDMSAVSGGGVFAGDRRTSGATAVVRLDSATLPELRC